MTKLMLFSAAAVLSTLIALPAYAQNEPRRERVEHEGPVGAAVDTAAGIAGAAVGTAGAIATAPLRDPPVYAAPSDCPPGTFFTGPDGQQHPCR
jgi:hypothetical protein